MKQSGIRRMGHAKPGVLVTAVGAPPGLNAVRALCESGRYRVVAADVDPWAAALYQHGVPWATLPPAAREDEYMRALLGLARMHSLSAVLPCIEEEIIVVARNRLHLLRHNLMAMVPAARTVMRAMDKSQAIAIAKDTGFDVPLTCVFEAGLPSGELRRRIHAFASGCRPPWIVKPVLGHGMRGVSRVESEAEAMNMLLQLKQKALLQEFIPGKVGSMHLVGLLYDCRARVHREFSSRSVRTLHSSGGPATAGISERHPLLIEQTKAIVERMGCWRGPVCAEWMLDPRDGKFKFMEVNPRLWGYGYLAVASGMNFPVDTVELALGRPIAVQKVFHEGMMLLRSTVDVTLPAAEIGQRV